MPPSDIVKRLLASSDLQPATEEPRVSAAAKKRKRKPETPCTEQALIKAHIRSLLTVDRKLAARNTLAEASLDRNAATSRSKKQLKRSVEQSQRFGRTAAAQSTIVLEPTSNKRRHAKEMKKKELLDIAKLLKRSQK